jgi:hypothetical protein
MTPEQLQAIRDKWAGARRRSSGAETRSVFGDAAGDIQRLLAEVDRLRHCCDEITRQYVRLSATNGAGETAKTVRAPRAAAMDRAALRSGAQ